SLSLTMLVADLEQGLFSLGSVKAVTYLHDLLHLYSAEIPDVELSRLAKLAIWPDLDGKLWPLEGDDKVFIARDERVCALFPQAPFLSWQVAGRNHVKATGLEPVDVKAVIEGLCHDAVAPLAVAMETQAVTSALRYVLDNSSRLTPDCANTLRERSQFLSDQGRILPLKELNLAESPLLRKVYGNYEARQFIDAGASLSLVNAARIESSLNLVDPACLACDLELGSKTKGKDSSSIDGQLTEQDETLLMSVVDRELVIRYLVDNLHKIPLPLMRKFTRLPLYLDTRGNSGSLPDEGMNARELNSKDLIYPCEHAVFRSVLSQLEVRLLAPQMESLAGPLLRGAGVIRAGLQTVVEQIQTKPVDSVTLLNEVQQLFVGRRSELARFYPPSSGGNANPILNNLKIWTTVDGQTRAAGEVLGGNLADLFQPNSPEYNDMESFCVTFETFSRLQALAPYMVPLPPERFLTRLIMKFARVGQPLAEQPKFLGSIDSIARLHGSVSGKDECRIPYVDALSNLTFEVSYFTSGDTVELLQGLPVLSSVLHDGLAKQMGLGAENEKEKTFTAQVARFWTQLTAPESGSKLKPLPTRLVISSACSDLNPERCKLLYKWLLKHESEVFYDKEARNELAAARAFVTSRGTIVKASALLLEGDVPELGIDWLPGSDIPDRLLRVLAKHLDIGSPKIEELIKTHIRKGYDDAIAAGDREGAARLLTWLARRLRDKSDKEIRQL
ncbi:MAG: hypothetical protein K2Z81_04495, partial [Cyanobacteria bacterium]|nr:hypothetical protein [Cyanobacteriota bacterium]